jgi:hypothetical protein
MFKLKRTTSLEFPKEKTVGWLSWLAGKMKDRSTSIFFVEEVGPGWSSTKGKWLAFGIVVAIGSVLAVVESIGNGWLRAALTFGLSILCIYTLGCWLESSSKIGVIKALIAGLIFGFWIALFTGLRAGLSLGAMFGLFGGGRPLGW